MLIDSIQASGIRITSLDDHIHIIHGKNRGRSPFCNTVLVLDKINAIIDPGCGLEILEKVASIAKIDLVLNSHSHPDHTSGNWLLGEISKPEIMVPADNIDSISDAQSLAYRFLNQDLAGLWLDEYLPVTGFKNFTPGSNFSDGHEFKLGKTRFIAIHTPGHLNDHYCLFEPDKRILLGFDIDLSPFGPWYGNPESDIKLFKRSIEKIRTIPIDIYFSSHAKPVKGQYIDRRIQSYASMFEKRDASVLSCIPDNKGATLNSIVSLSPIYDTDHSYPDKILHYGEKQMVKKHLDQIIDNGLIYFDHTHYKIFS